MDQGRCVHGVNQIHECLQGHAPKYQTEILIIYNSVIQYCTRQSNELHLPSAKTNKENISVHEIYRLQFSAYHSSEYN